MGPAAFAPWPPVKAYTACSQGLWIYWATWTDEPLDRWGPVGAGLHPVKVSAGDLPHNARVLLSDPLTPPVDL
ncbi:hypothetical protein hamaS1_21540 [Moorella sp. Hama-1]|nr:hypothetical protein hamaS1_21540 [Moorella sp. Hama-1]